MTRAISTRRPRWFGLIILTFALSTCFGVARALGDEAASQAITEKAEVTSYRVRVEPLGKEAAKTLVHPVEALLFGSGQSIECPANICRELVGWANVAGFSAGRLRNGEYIALWSDDGKIWWLRRGADLKTVTHGTVPEWPRQVDEKPRWTPSVHGYMLRATAPILTSDDIFLGVWEDKDKSDPRHLVALFREEGGELPYVDSKFCIIATTALPVVAVLESGLHNGIVSIGLVLRPVDAKSLHVVGYGLFPKSLQCRQPPT